MKNVRVTVWLTGLFLVFLLASPLSAANRYGQDDYSREQLTQMLAPIALYPDDLLSQVLMAATYPLEIVEADRFVRRNSLLAGENLNEALWDKDWDASVKELCHVPTLLALMSERLDETTNLGNAFLAQEDEVLAVIQDLRLRAYNEGNLSSNEKQKVIFRADGTIVIKPADPQVVHVPYYNPLYVYGSWWYPAWPPWYWGPAGGPVGRGFYYWPEYYVGFSFGFGYWSYFDWPGRTIVINVSRRPGYIRPDYDWTPHRGRWRHEPRHRRGVVYRDRSTAEKFGQFRQSDRVDDRKVRGFPEKSKVERPVNGRDRGKVVRGPVTASGSDNARPPGSNRTTAGERRTERKRVEQQDNKVATGSGTRLPAGEGEVVTTSPPRSRSNPEPAPRLRTGPVPPVATTRSQERERTTVFYGVDRGREESRSSIRGRSSRDSMQRSAPGRGSSSDEQPELRQNREDRGRFRR